MGQEAGRKRAQKGIWKKCGGSKTCLLCDKLEKFQNSISFSGPLYHFPVSFLRLIKIKPKYNAKNIFILTKKKSTLGLKCAKISCSFIFKKNQKWAKDLNRSSCHGAVEMNLTRNHEVVGLIPCLVQWVKDLALPWAVVWVAVALM